MHQTLWREFSNGFSNPAGPQDHDDRNYGWVRDYLFAQFGFWEKLKLEKVFGGDPILLSHFFLLPCVVSRPLIYNFYCIILKMSYNTASLKVKIPAKQPKPTTVKQPKPKPPRNVDIM